MRWLEALFRRLKPLETPPSIRPPRVEVPKEPPPPRIEVNPEVWWYNREVIEKLIRRIQEL